VAHRGLARRALDDGEATAELLGDGVVRYVSPIGRPGDGYALVVERDARTLQERLGALSTKIALLTVAAWLVAVLLAWALGGRALARRHARAVRHAGLDGLTELGNHRAFHEALRTAATRAGRNGDRVALAVFDVDDFKGANDRHGHQHGDELLRRVAGELAIGGAAARAFRTGGDEFALILPAHSEDDAAVAAARVQAALAAGGVGVSAGVSATRPEMRDERLLRREADAALYEAKRRGLREPVAFAEVREDIAICTPAKADALLRLLEAPAIPVAFQPIWEVATGRLLGLEALARPPLELGLSGPAEAFDVAEQLGRVRDLDARCVRSVLARAAEVPEGALLFLNLAPVSLHGAPEEIDWLLAAAVRHGIATERIVVEVTERSVTRAPHVVRSFRRLRKQGFRVALDDLGAGNAGLEMLRSFAFDFVKVDRAVVAAAPREAGARAVLSAVGAFARETGTLVILEGVEDPAALGTLQAVARGDGGSRPSIHGAQGFGLGRPQPCVDDAVAGGVSPVPTFQAVLTAPAERQVLET
jgi:diguanylate cyclase (GGDEF)-like protein